jgi:hypothetical protein
MAENDADPTVPIVCSECGTNTDLPISEVADTIEQHNERLHDGEEIAQVDPDIAEQITDLVAEDLGLL